MENAEEKTYSSISMGITHSSSFVRKVQFARGYFVLSYFEDLHIKFRDMGI